MKKVGILFGKENTFPWAFIEEVNKQGKSAGIEASAVEIDKLEQFSDPGYAVIIDRISQDVPFYRAYLKNAALKGTAVINNPFWWSADEKFFNNCLAESLGVPVPKTFLLPSKDLPDDTSSESFRNLQFPMDWGSMLSTIGFPAYMKPHAGGGWKSVYKVENEADLWEKHGETGQLVMMLQEEIIFEDYYRCYCLGGKYVHIMPYEPRNPHHLRYATQPKTQGEEHKKLMATIHKYVLSLNHALGYDFNTVEFAVRDGIPYAIDFCNPAPDADINSIGQENFDWIVEHAAKFAIERAKDYKPGKVSVTWGTFVKNAAGAALSVAAKASAVPKAATTPKTAVKKAAPKAPAKSAATEASGQKKPVATENKAASKVAAAKKTTTTAKKAPAKSTVVKKAAAPKTTETKAARASSKSAVKKTTPKE